MCGNYDADATIENGTCEYDSCGALIGCTISVACNYDPCAVTNDGSCDFFSCIVLVATTLLLATSIQKPHSTTVLVIL